MRQSTNEEYYKLFKKEKHATVFKPLYELTTKLRIMDRVLHRGKHMTITQIVFTKQIRYYLCRKLCDGLIIIILNT